MALRVFAIFFGLMTALLMGLSDRLSHASSGYTLREVLTLLNIDNEISEDVIQQYQAFNYVRDNVSDSPQILVGVIDTGIDGQHPELNGQLWEGPNGERGYNTVTESIVYDLAELKNQTPGCGYHGTSVSGLIVAIGNGQGSVGTAGNGVAQVIPIKGDRGESCLYDEKDSVDGIRFAVARGAKVINISNGDGHIESSGYRSAIESAVRRGVTVVISGGNLNLPTPLFPGRYALDIDGAIVVGALNSQLEKLDIANSGVEIWAPGERVGTLYSDGGFGWGSGASHATPIVAGAAAQWISYMMSKGVTPSPAQVESQIISSARLIHGRPVLQMFDMLTKPPAP